MSLCQAILNDIANEKIIYVENLRKTIEDLTTAKDTLKSMKNSIDINDNKEKKEMELTHYKMNFVQYNDDNIFKYTLVIIINVSMKSLFLAF